MKKSLYIIFLFLSILYAEEFFPKKTDIVNLSLDEKKFLIENSIDCVVIDRWPPFNFKENGKLVGISQDFWELIKKKTLIKSECRSVKSFDEVINLIKNKEADITLSTAFVENRLYYGRFSNPYVSYPIAIATDVNENYISSTSMLNGKKVAVGKSYSVYHILKSKYPEIKFIEVEDNIEALRLLSRGEVFAVVDILPVLSLVISDYGFKNIKISGTTEFNFDIRFMVRNDYEELIPIINKGIEAVSKDELNEIKSRWLSVRLETVIDYKKYWEAMFIIVVILLIIFYRQFILNRHNRKLQEANEEIEKKTLELEVKTKELAKQKELFEKIYKESTDGIFLMALEDKKIIDCNSSTLRILSYDDKKEFLALCLEDLFPFNQPSGLSSIFKLYKYIDKAILEGSSSFEFVFKNKNSKQIWVEVVFTTIDLDNNKTSVNLLSDLSNKGIKVRVLYIKKPNLENAFIKLMD